MNGLDVASAILRGTHLAALTSLFGTLVFMAVVIRARPVTPPGRLLDLRLARLSRCSVLLALALGAAWFLLRTAAIAGADGLLETLGSVPSVALGSQFGRLILVRFALLLALVALCAAVWSRRRLASPPDRTALPAAILLAGIALGLQAATSHAGAMGGTAGPGLIGAEFLHVLAAGAWLGGLAPLLIVLATMPPDDSALAVKRFFPLGLAGVLVIAATSVVQSLALVGSVPALVGTTYGRVALLKLALFLLLLVFAALNRFVFGARHSVRLRRSIAAEAGVAMLVMVAAGALAHLTPGVHEPAVWPFPWRVDPAAPGGLVAAYPSSFFVSPTGFDAAAIVRGERLYRANCPSCHGVRAQGDGPAAGTLPIAPADLTARRVLGYGDGDLFWFVGHAADPSTDDRWDLVDYLRAHNQGEFVRTGGRGLYRLRIPRFNAVCADGQALDPDGLRGKVLRIVVPASAQGSSPMQASARVATIILPADPAQPYEDASCTAQPEALQAIAVLLGTTPDALAGSEFLVDPNGWLRAQWQPGQPGGWATPGQLLARAQALSDHPLPAEAASGHSHRH